MVLMPLLSRLLTLLVILTMPLFLARLTLIPIKSLRDRKSGSAGMPRPISYAVFCLKKKKNKRYGVVVCAVMQAILAFASARIALPFFATPSRVYVWFVVCV